MPRDTPDFVSIRLTAAGRAFAGTGETLRLANAHSDYTFTGVTPQKVMRRGEMPLLLSYHLSDGTPAFELAPDAPAAATTNIPLPEVTPMSNNFEPQSKNLRTLVLSTNKQSAWGAAAVLADGALTRIQRFDGSAVLDLTPDRRSDKMMSGKGSYFATNGQVTSFDTKISGIKSELSDWLAGWLLSFCLGKDVVTGSASPYVHTHTFDQSTRQAIPTTAYLVDSDGLHYKVVDLHVSSVTFTIPATGAIQAEYDLMGTGILVPGAMVTLPAIPSETYILGSDCDFLFGNVGATTSFLGRHMTSTIKFENSSKVHRAPGGGLYGIFIRKEDPKFSMTSTIAATATDDLFTRLLNDQKTALGINANSDAAAQLAVSFPSSNLKTTKMGFDGDMTVFNIEIDETTCYQAGNVQPLSATVTNAVAAYLTAYSGS